MPTNANLFVQEISHQVSYSMPRKSPIDTAKALGALGYIERSGDVYIKTDLGEKRLIEQSILALTNEVISSIRGQSSIGVERFTCYLCEKLKSVGHFGSKCQFQYEDDETHRVSMSPCKSCLASHHITQSRMFG